MLVRDFVKSSEMIDKNTIEGLIYIRMDSEEAEKRIKGHRQHIFLMLNEILDMIADDMEGFDNHTDAKYFLLESLVRFNGFHITKYESILDKVLAVFKGVFFFIFDVAYEAIWAHLGCTYSEIINFNTINGDGQVDGVIYIMKHNGVTTTMIRDNDRNNTEHLLVMFNKVLDTLAISMKDFVDPIKAKMFLVESLARFNGFRAFTW